MNIAAFEHVPVLSFRQPIARNTIRFRLLTARNDIERCSLVCWKRSDPLHRTEWSLQIRTQDQAHAEWTAEVTFPEEAHYIKYFFRLTGLSGEERFYCEHGVSDTEPDTGFFRSIRVM